MLVFLHAFCSMNSVVNPQRSEGEPFCVVTHGLKYVVLCHFPSIDRLIVYDKGGKIWYPGIFYLVKRAPSFSVILSLT